jgi:SAM-dependent methyltransferase
MDLVRHLYVAVVQPAPRARPAGFLRRIVGLPVIFDLTALAMQTRDLARLGRIRDSYPAADDEHHRRAHDYNAGVSQQKRITTTRRAEDIYEILALPPRPLNRERLLIVGPRNIHEFLIAWVHGFNWDLMQGIDLYSTNPKIRTMNMEGMDFPDQSFDAIGMSATISYAKDTARCLREMARVLKPGGRFAFGMPYHPQRTDWHGDRISASEMRRLLHEVGFEIYYHHAWDKTSKLGQPQTSHRFGAVKRDPSNRLLDPLVL